MTGSPASAPPSLSFARFGSNTPFTIPATPYCAEVPSGTFGFHFIQRLRPERLFASPGAATREQMAAFLAKGLFNPLLPPTQPLIASLYPPVLAHGTAGTFPVTAEEAVLPNGPVIG